MIKSVSVYRTKPAASDHPLANSKLILDVRERHYKNRLKVSLVFIKIRFIYDKIIEIDLLIYLFAPLNFHTRNAP